MNSPAACLATNSRVAETWFALLPWRERLGYPYSMSDRQDFETRFIEVFQPIFLWGVGALELALILYTLYMEFVSGTGPSLLSTVLPLSVVIAVVWAVLAVLITLAVVRIKNRAPGS